MNGIALFGDCKLSGKIKGVVKFHQCSPGAKTKISINLSGFAPNAVQACHIHEYGNFIDGCNSASAHYNPHNVDHGSPFYKGGVRHVGDLLCNLFADELGNVNVTFEDDLVSLYPPFSIYGRSVMIHEGEDDYGLGGDEESLKTGNAGKRVACAIIGVSRPMSCS